MVGDRSPVPSRDEGRDGLEIRVGPRGHGLVKVELLLCEPLVSSTHQLQGQGHKKKLGVRCTRSLEDLDRVLGIASEKRSGGCHGMDRGRILGVDIGIRPTRVMPLHVAPSTNLETELAVMRPLCLHAVKSGQVSFLAVRSDGSLPLRCLRDRRSTCQSSRRITAWNFSVL